MANLCSCSNKAAYVLHLINIPTNIFCSIECKDNHSYIECELHHDRLLTTLESMESWSEAYHAAKPDVIQSILRHGEILMADDVALDGGYIKRSISKLGEPIAIWTSPDPEGALKRVDEAVYDMEQTKIKIMLRVLHRPYTFAVHRGVSAGGYDLYSTDRRGSIFILGLRVYIYRCSFLNIPDKSLSISSYSSNQSFNCPNQREAFRALKKLKIPTEILNGHFNVCYCKRCYPDSRPDTWYCGGEQYTVPRGWVRFGLLVNDAFLDLNSAWDVWNRAYHGCQPENMMSIITHRGMLTPGDCMMDGTKLESRHAREKCYYVSPCVNYSAHPWYARPKVICINEEYKYLQTCVILQVRPNACDRQRETEGGAMKLLDFYGDIPENEVEWYSRQRGSTHPIGILIRMIDRQTAAKMYPNHMHRFPDLPTPVERPIALVRPTHDVKHRTKITLSAPLSIERFATGPVASLSATSLRPRPVKPPSKLASPHYDYTYKPRSTEGNPWRRAVGSGYTGLVASSIPVIERPFSIANYREGIRYTTADSLSSKRHDTAAVFPGSMRRAQSSSNLLLSDDRPNVESGSSKRDVRRLSFASPSYGEFVTKLTVRAEFTS